MSAVKLYVPLDTAARAVGADEVAAAIRAEAAVLGAEVVVVRNGSRGLLWLEPLVEVETPQGRVAYGPVSAADVPGLFAAGFLTGDTHPLALGLTAEIPYLKAQTRITFARVGVTDPLSLADYRALGGFAGFDRAKSIGSAGILAELTASGLRGRGGAGFPTAIKWKTVADALGDEKFIVCNADEGDSGTFADRMLIEGDPFLLIEGMAIAGLAVGAREGYVYLRSEYPAAVRILNQAIELAAATVAPFRLQVRVGAGAYVCGEETALLESIEGKRGMVRAKPPLPALVGLFGKPTVVNNVLSLAAVPDILADGGAAYAAHGIDRSRGTQPFQIAGNVKHGGLFEAPFGVSIKTLVEDWGGGTRSGRAIKAVQVGGPLGGWLRAGGLDVPADYEALAAAGSLLGHGGLVVYDNSVDMAREAREAMAFCAVESCGKCTPCRIGSTRGTELLDRLLAGGEPEPILALLEDLCEVMVDGSLCALGGLTPLPVRTAIQHFREDFQR